MKREDRKYFPLDCREAPKKNRRGGIVEIVHPEQCERERGTETSTKGRAESRDGRMIGGGNR